MENRTLGLMVGDRVQWLRSMEGRKKGEICTIVKWPATAGAVAESSRGVHLVDAQGILSRHGTGLERTGIAAFVRLLSRYGLAEAAGVESMFGRGIAEPCCPGHPGTFCREKHGADTRYIPRIDEWDLLPDV